MDCFSGEPWQEFKDSRKLILEVFNVDPTETEPLSTALVADALSVYAIGQLNIKTYQDVFTYQFLFLSILQGKEQYISNLLIIQICYQPFSKCKLELNSKKVELEWCKKIFICVYILLFCS